MKILNKTIKPITKKRAKRLGRGISAGGGKTAGRGTKGQKSRAGHNIPNQFEGGQSNLSLRLPKTRGFRGHQDSAKVISLSTLSKYFKSGDTVNYDSLVKAKIIKIGEKPKILNNGDLNFTLNIEGIAISEKAAEQIKKIATKEQKTGKTSGTTTVKKDTKKQAE